jgi:signal transduction histidine kinase
MQLHSYKNAFTSVAMQLNLAKIHLNKDNKDACLSHIEHGMSTLNKYSDIFIRNLRLLSNNYNEKRAAPINLVSCIESALAICNDDEIKITHSYDSDIVYIYGEQYHITEVFVNILNNAVTAVNKISRIPDIKINLKIEAEWCMAEIIDNGIGIKKSKKRLIFEPFYSTNCYNNGSGIGLYYTKKIVKAHNGEIRCDSHPGVYTRFQIAFPVIMKGE